MNADEIRKTTLDLPAGLREIAAQLAELNAKLEPDAIFEAFKKVGDMIEKMPPDQHRRNL